MPRDQQSRQHVDPTSGCRVMSSCKSHENSVQGHLVTLGPGVKTQAEQQYFMPLAPTCVYGQCQYGNTTKVGTLDVFSELTHQCESCIEGNSRKQQFTKPKHTEIIQPSKHGAEGPLEIMACKERNGLDGSSIQPLVFKLCRVESCMKMSLRNTWSLSVQE